MILAFARSLGEFGATAVFVGSIEGQSRTLPLAIYAHLQTASGGASVGRLVGFSVVVAVLAMVLSEITTRRVGRRVGRGHAA
jgi:molybdate transport system permease protein